MDLLAFARIHRAAALRSNAPAESGEARGQVAKGDRGVARRALVHRSSTAAEVGKPGGFGVVPLGFATGAPPCGRDASLENYQREACFARSKKGAGLGWNRVDAMFMIASWPYYLRTRANWVLNLAIPMGLVR